MQLSNDNISIIIRYSSLEECPIIDSYKISILQCEYDIVYNSFILRDDNREEYYYFAEKGDFSRVNALKFNARGT